jgi:hypothetical protein
VGSFSVKLKAEFGSGRGRKQKTEYRKQNSGVRTKKGRLGFEVIFTNANCPEF